MAKKKAVLVGCNYPGTDAELRGCINDVRRIRQSLVERFRFEESEIKVLVDTPLMLGAEKGSTAGMKRRKGEEEEPTGKNIKAALQGLVEGARSGDVLFFHYSGHGVRLPVEPGDPDNTGFDECIVPSDMNLITDDDFREIVNKVPPGVTLTMISDSCHSGGLIDNEKEQIGNSSLHGQTASSKQPPGKKPSAPKLASPSPKKASGGGKKPAPPKGGKAGKRDLDGLVGSHDEPHHDGDPDQESSDHPSGESPPRNSNILHKIRHKIHEKMEKHGIHLHRRYEELDDHFQNVCYEGDEELQYVKSRALPLSSLMLILKQKTGEENMDVEKIRPTLFHMFRDDASSKVKRFVKGLQMNMQQHMRKISPGSSSGQEDQRDEDEQQHHYHGAAIGALANKLFKHKVDDDHEQDIIESGDADDLTSTETRAMGGKKGAAVSSTKNNNKAAARRVTDMGILISGCQSHQTSADASGENNEGYGAMSNAIQIVLARTPGSITNRDLVTQVRQILKQQGFTQQPGLYCSDDNANAPFVC